jgi:hypothetical protein
MEKQKKKAPTQSQTRGVQAGLMPVRVQLPKTGKQFKFEQLLVPPKHIHLEAEYKRMDKGYFDRRKVSTCTIA